MHPLKCVGCECEAPAGAKPDPLGYWLCRKCTADMRWAMRCAAAIFDRAEPAPWRPSAVDYLGADQSPLPVAPRPLVQGKTVRRRS